MSVRNHVEQLKKILKIQQDKEKFVLDYIQNMLDPQEEFLDKKKYPEVYEILIDLALELDYYEPNEKYQQEDIRYFGDQELEAKIRNSLRSIEILLD